MYDKKRLYYHGITDAMQHNVNWLRYNKDYSYALGVDDAMDYLDDKHYNEQWYAA